MRFATYKLIVADRRRDGPDSRKARKDLMQVEPPMGALAEDRTADLAKALAEVDRAHPWKSRH